MVGLGLGEMESSSSYPYGGRDPRSDEELRWALLQALLRSLPEPEWTEERSDRLFARVMATIERRQRVKQWALRLTSTVALPFTAALLMGRFLR